MPGLSDLDWAARATVRAVERFYTTVEKIRERVTGGWHDSTLLKESRFQMTFRTVAVQAPLHGSRWGVAEFRDGAVFCQQRLSRLPRSFGFDRCSRPVLLLDGVRRFQD
jgi:hypothetical protein